MPRSPSEPAVAQRPWPGAAAHSPGEPAVAERRRPGAAAITRPALPAGLLLGALGVLAFSFSFPATKLAVGGLDPWLVAFGRAVVAAVLAAAVLCATRAPRPGRRLLGRLAVVGGGVVVGRSSRASR